MNNFQPDREHALDHKSGTYLYLLRVQNIHIDAGVEALQLVFLIMRLHKSVIEVEDDCYLI